MRNYHWITGWVLYCVALCLIIHNQHSQRNRLELIRTQFEMFNQRERDDHSMAVGYCDDLRVKVEAMQQIISSGPGGTYAGTNWFATETPRFGTNSILFTMEAGEPRTNAVTATGGNGGQFTLKAITPINSQISIAGTNKLRSSMSFREPEDSDPTAASLSRMLDRSRSDIVFDHFKGPIIFTLAYTNRYLWLDWTTNITTTTNRMLTIIYGGRTNTIKGEQLGR